MGLPMVNKEGKKNPLYIYKQSNLLTDSSCSAWHKDALTGEKNNLSPAKWKKKTTSIEQVQRCRRPKVILGADKSKLAYKHC